MSLIETQPDLSQFAVPRDPKEIAERLGMDEEDFEDAASSPRPAAQRTVSGQPQRNAADDLNDKQDEDFP
jgi:hypothetical protein